MTDLQQWWTGATSTMSFRVVDDSLPTTVHPLKVMLTADGDVMVYPRNNLQVWSGDWSSTHRSTINVEFPVMVAGQPNLPVKHQVALLEHTDIYASTTNGTQFMLVPWQQLVDGPSYEDIAILRGPRQVRHPGRAHRMESGRSSSSAV